jgi:tetratricopeptide (TPR) repeat protein
MKVCVYAIALNEAQFARRFAASCREADVVLVADTGSTDDTVAALRAEGVIVESISVRPWRFDDARNAALALVPADVDVCISIDMDEVFRPGWRQALEAKWTDGVNQGYFTYIVSHRPDGSPDEVFLNDRIHSRHGFRWRYPCHEGIFADRVAVRSVIIEDLCIEHFPDVSKSRSQYLPLLEQAVRETPWEPRMAFCLGREYLHVRRYEEAKAELERAIGLEAPMSPGQRNLSIRQIGRCLDCLDRPDEALDAYRRAVAEGPDMRGAWLELAQALHERKAWTECYDTILHVLAMPDGPSDYGHDSYLGIVAEDVASIAAWTLGHRQEALDYARRAAAAAPFDGRIAGNLATIERIMSQGAAS